MDELDQLALEIELLRHKLHDSIKEEPYFISDKIIVISQQLDELLVKYNRIKEKDFN